MHKGYLFIALAAVAAAATEGVVLTAWQAGGAGGAVEVGPTSDSTIVTFAAGGAVGGLHELDDATIAALGFWPTPAPPVSTAVQPGSVAARVTIHAAYDGSRLNVDLHAASVSPASIRLVGVDGRAVEPAWSGTIAAGSTRRTIDMDRHRGQILYLLVEVGAERRTFQVQDVSR